MTVLLTLTSAGTNSGPFDLYTELDGYTNAFETGVTRNQLLAGYLSAVVPDNATIVRATSLGACVNSLDIILDYGSPTTTTTSTVGPTTTTTTTLFVPICTPLNGTAVQVIIPVTTTTTSTAAPTTTTTTTVAPITTTTTTLAPTTTTTTSLVGIGATLSFDASENLICGGIGNTYYYDAAPFSNATGVWTTPGLTVIAPSGWYSDTNIYRYWDGVTLAGEENCGIVYLGFDELVSATACADILQPYSISGGQTFATATALWEPDAIGVTPAS